MIQEHQLTIVDSLYRRRHSMVVAICSCGDSQSRCVNKSMADEWFIEHLRTATLRETGRSRDDLLAAVSLYLAECGYAFPCGDGQGGIDDTSAHVAQWFMVRPDQSPDETVASLLIGAGIIALGLGINPAESIYRAASRDRLNGPVGAR